MPAWTYSRLSGYETCAKQFYHTKVLKDVPDPPNAAGEWGDRVHKAFEDRLLNGAALPEGMTQWTGIVDKFNALPGEKLVEFEFAVDANFQPTSWKTAWSRGKADLVVRHKSTVLIVDWKSGKKKPTEQLDLYAAYAKAFWPETERIQTSFVWLPVKQQTKAKIEASQVPIIGRGSCPGCGAWSAPTKMTTGPRVRRAYASNIAQLPSAPTTGESNGPKRSKQPGV